MRKGFLFFILHTAWLSVFSSLLLLCACGGAQAAVQTASDSLRFYPQPGIFGEDHIELKIQGQTEGMRILYTTDGSIPLPGKAKEWTSSLQLDSSCVIRARCMDARTGAGRVQTATYLLREAPDFFPVVSLTAEPDSFAIISGDFQADRYISSHFEYFVDMGQRRVSKECRIRIAGGTSRVFAKKSFKVETPLEDPFRFKFFSTASYNTFSGLTLRADVTSGKGSNADNLAGERIRNELAWKLNESMGGNVLMQAWKPVKVFLNGAYLGLYTMMETKGAELIRNRFGEKEIDMLEGMDPTVIAGDATAWSALLDQMNRLDPESEEFERLIRDNIDLKSLFDLWILESYCANFDFEENIRYWRPRKPGGKWQWMAFDFDAWGKAEDNTMSEMLDNEDAFGVFILGRITMNPVLRNEFLLRLENVCNHALRTEAAAESFEWVRKQSASELQRDRRRWEKQIVFAAPGADAEKMSAFLQHRWKFLLEEAASFYQLGTVFNIRFSATPAGGGKVEVNGSEINRLPWTGVFIPGIEAELKVIPQNAFRFSGWPSGLEGNGNTLRFIPQKNMDLNLQFIRP